VLNADRTWQPTCFLFPSALNLLLGALYLNKLFSAEPTLGPGAYDVVDGLDARGRGRGRLLYPVRRDAIERVGVLMRAIMYGEEADWRCCFRKAGWKVLFTPGAQIVHLGGASSAHVKGPMCLQLRASLLLFLRKHRAMASYVAGCAFVSLFFLLRLPVWLATAAPRGTVRELGDA
jgi:hypothetical protein